ncbi:hypothetical protein D9615_008719 [Tricholomella constricta]|uniref:Uncharacterized protein n=1 Tax=Tricholomella constricta TaxID=117010 RepID=A0A8H5M2A0_9AGAR|nr:hypothetical protein D9615_008719 [Tricholomella constricta]
MARLPFSFLALSERVESVIGAIQTSFAMVPNRTADQECASITAAELAVWRAHRPYLQQIASYPRYSHTIMEDRDGGSSVYGTDGSETLVSEEASHTYYAPPAAQEERAAFLLGGKILPDIANFDRQQESSDDSASDTDTFYSYQSDSPVEAQNNPAALHPPSARAAGPWNRAPDLTEGVTALSPPPLRHSGKTRSKIVSVPRDAPGTCPIHGCAECGLCDPDKPLLFTI